MEDAMMKTTIALATGMMGTAVARMETSSSTHTAKTVNAATVHKNATATVLRQIG